MTTEPETSPENEDTLTPADQEGLSVPLDGGQDRLAALEAENSRLKDHMLRALAEADNSRKRALKEREDATKFAISGFARDMIEIADNLRRALDAMPGGEAGSGEDPLIKNLIAGIEATERALLKAFDKHGIKKLEPLGEAFDPHYHEVMFEAPVPGKKTGTIIQLVETGYTLNDRLLRPARVGVARGDENGKNGAPPRLDETV